MATVEPRSCEPGGGGLLLPLGGDAEQSLPDFLRAVMYGVGLLYCFLGVSIVADVFMAAIERITSAKKKKVVKETDQEAEVEVDVWNPTVANLTLMALGSSAPEILLSVLETCGKGFYSGKLGPSTIVGSAAFNLLVIIAVCIACVPDGEVRRIKQDDVFLITAAFSVFAYVWLLLVVQISSKDVICVWEGMSTFAMFPLLVVLSYAADVGLFGGGEEAGSPDQSAENPGDLPPGEKKREIDPEAVAEPRSALTAYRDSLPVELVGVAHGAQAGGHNPRYGGPVAGSSFAPSARGTGHRDTSNPQVLGRLSADRSPANTDSLGMSRSRDGPCQAPHYMQGRGSFGMVTGFAGQQALQAGAPSSVQWSGGLSPGKRTQLSVQNSRRRARAELSGGRRSPAGSRDRHRQAADSESSSSGHAGRWSLEPGRPMHWSAREAHSGWDHSSRGSDINGSRSRSNPGSWREPHPVFPNNAEILVLGHANALQHEARRDRLPSPPQDPLACITEMRSGVDTPAPEAQGPSEEDDDDDESWWGQVQEALYCNGSPKAQDEATLADWTLHGMLVPWKLLYALTVPPTSYAGGWLCFFVALAQIGALTAIVGDLAELFGCVAGIEDSITAITFVALGTSLPDLFASKSAALGDETADASIVNVTGSNSVNVFLGIGLPWMMAALHWNSAGATEKWQRTYPEIFAEYPDGAFVVPAGDLSFSVIVFTIAAVIALVTIRVRRFQFGGELGGPRGAKMASSLLLVLLWFLYIGLSIWKVNNPEADAPLMFAAVSVGFMIIAGSTLVMALALKFIGEFWSSGGSGFAINPASPRRPPHGQSWTHALDSPASAGLQVPRHTEQDPRAALPPTVAFALLEEVQEKLARFDGAMADFERITDQLSHLQPTQEGACHAAQDRHDAPTGHSGKTTKPRGLRISRHCLP